MTSIGQEIAEAVDRCVLIIYIANADINFFLKSAHELDERVANELEAMEGTSVLPNRWNGPTNKSILAISAMLGTRRKTRHT